MKFDPHIHHRRSIRLKGYDYTQPGAYFVTLVTYGRECLFGEIDAGEMKLNPWGQIARDEWFKSTSLRINVQLYEDQFVVMPNHIHGIIWLVESDVGARRRRAPTAQFSYEKFPETDSNPPTMEVSPESTGEAFGKPTVGSIPTILRSYKSAVTYQINLLRPSPSIPIWQRNYYEHIVRNEPELDRIRLYILHNPVAWAADRENLARSI